MKTTVLLLLLTLGAAGRPGWGQTTDPEIGGKAAGGSPAALTTLDAEWDFSLTTVDFSDRDLEATYGSLTGAAIGASFLVAPQVRTFLSVGYGKKSGDPYYGLPGFAGGPEITLKTVPFLLGLKCDLARSTRIRVQAGCALMLAYVREGGVPFLDTNGHLNDAPVDNLLTGYRASFAPEWLLGDRLRAVGLEVGYGGVKGTLSNDSQSHDIDLTGLSGRLYLILGL